LKNPGASLQALASSGLPAGAAAALNSAIGSLSSGGAIPIKLPTVGTNTTDRSGPTSLLSSVFGSSKIPVPNFAGNPATTGETSATAALKHINDVQAQVEDIGKQIQAKFNEVDSILSDAKVAKATYNDDKNTLPAGDPQIAADKSRFDTLLAQFNAKLDEVDALRKQRDQLIDTI